MIEKIKHLKTILLFIAVMMALASSAMAVPPNGVKWTVHNLGTSGDIKGSFVSNDSRPIGTEICIFCHTPHNAVQGKVFLWNRSSSPSNVAFRLYTISMTLTAATKAAVISNESKMCMSCHDGVTAMNAMANPSIAANRPTFDTTMDQFSEIYGAAEGWGPNIGQGTAVAGTGGDLTNDHPISFSYTGAQSVDTMLKDISVPKGQGLLFWGPNGDKLECVTCHDPHVNYGFPAGLRNTADIDVLTRGGDVAYKPFLRRSNESSGLCFACHNK